MNFTETELRDAMRTSRQVQESVEDFIRRIMQLMIDTGSAACSPAEIGGSLIAFETARVHLRFRGLDVDQDDQP